VWRVHLYKARVGPQLDNQLRRGSWYQPVMQGAQVPVLAPASPSLRQLRLSRNQEVDMVDRQLSRAPVLRTQLTTHQPLQDE
jgi:hypothetical protein